MDQKTLTGMAIGAVLVFVLGWLYINVVRQDSVSKTDTAFIATSTTAVTTLPKNDAVPTATTPIKNGTPTFKSLLTQKGNYQCDFEQVSDTGVSHNVIYISGGKLRAEFRSTMKGQEGSNLSVYDGRYLYTWREGTTVGTKSLITSLGQLPTAIPKDLTSGTIYGDNYNSVGWQCHTWLVDKTLLTPPSYVTFK